MEIIRYICVLYTKKTKKNGYFVIYFVFKRKGGNCNVALLMLPLEITIGCTYYICRSAYVRRIINSVDLRQWSSISLLTMRI